MRPGRSATHAREQRRRHWQGPDAPPAQVVAGVRAEIAARRGPGGLRPGACVLGGGFFVRFGTREVVAGAGPGGMCWWCCNPNAFFICRAWIARQSDATS